MLVYLKNKAHKTKKPGDIVSVREDKKHSLSWHDQRQVNTLTTVHDGKPFTKEVTIKVALS